MEKIDAMKWSGLEDVITDRPIITELTPEKERNSGEKSEMDDREAISQ